MKVSLLVCFPSKEESNFPLQKAISETGAILMQNIDFTLLHSSNATNDPSCLATARLPTWNIMKTWISANEMVVRWKSEGHGCGEKDVLNPSRNKRETKRFFHPCSIHRANQTIGQNTVVRQLTRNDLNRNWLVGPITGIRTTLGCLLMEWLTTSWNFSHRWFSFHFSRWLVAGSFPVGNKMIGGLAWFTAAAQRVQSTAGRDTGKRKSTK